MGPDNLDFLDLSLDTVPECIVGKFSYDSMYEINKTLSRALYKNLR